MGGKNKISGHKRRRLKGKDMANVNPQYGIWKERFVELYSFKPGSSIQKPVGEAFNMLGKCVQAVFLNLFVLMVINSSDQILPSEMSIHNKNPKFKEMYSNPDQYYWIKGHVHDNISNSTINVLVINKDEYRKQVNQIVSTPPPAHVVRSHSLNTYAICSTSKQHEGLPVEALDHFRTLHHVTLEPPKPIPQTYKPTKDTSDRAGCHFRVDELDAARPTKQTKFDVMYRESRLQVNAAAIICQGNSIDLCIQIAPNHLVINTKRISKPSQSVTVFDGSSGRSIVTPHVENQRIYIVPVQALMPSNPSLLTDSPIVSNQPADIQIFHDSEYVPPFLEGLPLVASDNRADSVTCIWNVEDIWDDGILNKANTAGFAPYPVALSDFAEPFQHAAHVHQILNREPLRNKPSSVDGVELGKQDEEEDVEYSNFPPAYLAILYRNADLQDMKEMCDNMNHRN